MKTNNDILKKEFEVIWIDFERLFLSSEAEMLASGLDRVSINNALNRYETMKLFWIDKITQTVIPSVEKKAYKKGFKDGMMGTVIAPKWMTKTTLPKQKQNHSKILK